MEEPVDEAGEVDGELRDELLELEAPVEAEVPLELVPLELVPLELLPLLPVVDWLAVVPLPELVVAWWAPAAAAATAPVRTTPPTAVPRVIRRISLRPRARRLGPDRGTDLLRSRRTGAGFR